MDGTDLEIIAKSRGGVANGVQTSYANALDAANTCRADERVPASIGYQCPVYAPGMGPKTPGMTEPFSENLPRSMSPAPVK